MNKTRHTKVGLTCKAERHKGNRPSRNSHACPIDNHPAKSDNRLHRRENHLGNSDSHYGRTINIMYITA